MLLINSYPYLVETIPALKRWVPINSQIRSIIPLLLGDSWGIFLSFEIISWRLNDITLALNKLKVMSHGR